MLTKKDLLEAIEDMPMDAEVLVREYDRYGDYEDEKIYEVECDIKQKRIIIC